MKKRMIQLSIVILVMAVCAGGWYVFFAQSDANPAVQTAVLKRSDLIDSVLVSGYVKSSESRQVYTAVSGQFVEYVNVEVGSVVKAGDVLAKLDTEQLEFEIRQAELTISNAEASLSNERSASAYSQSIQTNSLKMAEAELKTAQRDAELTKALYEAGTCSFDDLSRAESALENARIAFLNAQTTLTDTENRSTLIAKNTIELQKIGLEKLLKTRDDSVITAPMTGL
jgi:multidrug efflux pump subunit AcrA (membrane-fusion protein)